MNVKRVDPQQVADERTALREWLEYHRATLLMKIDGLTDAQARARSIVLVHVGHRRCAGSADLHHVGRRESRLQLR